MDDFQLLLLSVVITFSGLFIIAALPTKLKSVGNATLVLLNAILTSIPAIHALLGQPLDVAVSGTAFWGQIPFRVDSMSAWFILIINFTSINGAVYGIGYLKPYQGQKTGVALHWMLYPVFHLSMLWVCIIQHSMLFLVAWELMSLSSLFLVLFDYQQKSTLKAGLNYLVQMHVGVALITVGFIWVYVSEKSFDFAAIANFCGGHSNLGFFMLLFVGFGIKAGFIPLHTWLPQAHPAAPSHVSGVMSGVIVKLGIYGIFRTITFLRCDLFVIGEVVLGVSLITGLFGIFNAAVNRNYKKMLAYCTVENIGVIGMGIGLGLMGLGGQNTYLAVAGFGGALLHTLNHSLFKSLLFFAAGSIYQQTYTKNMEKLGGLFRRMPQTALFFLVGSLAIGGLPPFNGFISEFILYRGFLEGISSSDLYFTTLMIISIAGLAIVGGLSLLAFTKTFSIIFLGAARTELPHQPREVSMVMRVPQYLIIAVMLSVGIFPAWYFSVALQVVQPLMPSGVAFVSPHTSSMFGFLSKIGVCSMLFMGLIAIIYLVRGAITKSRPQTIAPTWGCGYVAPNPSMQYTGKSFSKSLGKLWGFILTEKKEYPEICTSEIFPAKRSYSSYYVDNFAIYIQTIADRLVRGMNYFQFIQNGKIQAYILYGLLFIVIVFFGTLFNFI